MQTATSTEPAGQRRSARAALWVLQAVTAAGFVAAAAAKFTRAEQIEAVFTAMGVGGWLMYAIGVLEVAGALGLLIPRVAGLSATAFVVLMLGALATHAAVGGFAIPAVVMLCLAAVIAWARRRETTALVGRLTGRSPSALGARRSAAPKVGRDS